MGRTSSTLLGSFGEVMKRCIHPLAGSAGAILAGWATDRFFGGRRAPVIAIAAGAAGPVLDCLPVHQLRRRGWLVITVVGIIGFCTYGPHILMVGHAAQDFGRKQGAAGAAGFIDAMGYIGASLAGWGAGALIRVARLRSDLRRRSARRPSWGPCSSASSGRPDPSQANRLAARACHFSQAALASIAELNLASWQLSPERHMTSRERVALALAHKEPDRGADRLLGQPRDHRAGS